MAERRLSETEGERKQREADFQDAAIQEETRSKLWSRYYAITEASEAAYSHELESRSGGATALEFGCGATSMAFLAAEHGARSVVGIDISPASVDDAEHRAESLGLSNLSFRVMDAEQLDFEDNSFDLIFGRSVLHHLDLNVAIPELTRALRPGGSAVFVEPLGHNPLINLYRSRTPTLRTPDEHPLKVAELNEIGSHFEQIDTEYFHLQGLAAVPFRRTRAFSGMLKALDSADRGMFRVAPFMRRFAWQVMLVLTGPHKPRSSEAPPLGQD